jgi:hypothetical protein
VKTSLDKCFINSTDLKYYDSVFYLQYKKNIQKWLADMGTGITDVIGEPHNFLPLGPTNFKNSECGR